LDSIIGFSKFIFPTAFFIIGKRRSDIVTVFTMYGSYCICDQPIAYKSYYAISFPKNLRGTEKKLGENQLNPYPQFN
jgi:hypothetical protein